VTETSNGTVIVGVDGSAGSAQALRWALDHADHLGQIQPVMAYENGPLVRDASVGEAYDPDPYWTDADRRLRSFLDVHAPWLAGAGLVIESRPGPGLLKAASSAKLVVVGTRGHGGRVDLSVGSVGSYCAHHSPVPVALIPGTVPPPHGHLDVVVGFDGSTHSRIALHWTLTHLLASAHVTVVQAFSDHTVAGEVLAPSVADSEATVVADLGESVASVLASLEQHPPIEVAAVPGDPRAVLRTAADGADLLVIGARGHGVLDRLLLGSVSNALVQHPTVPTIVVPHER
jgi:nucleotide-binding universal stress UspA family protein